MTGRWVVGCLLATGCVTPFSKAVDTGQAALERGDRMTAISSFQRACLLSPKDSICDEVKLLEAEFVADTLADAKPKCDAGEAARCLAALWPARQVSRRPELEVAANIAGELHLARCSAIGLETPKDAVEMVRCAEALRASVATAAYTRSVADVRARASAAVARSALELSAKGEPTMAWLRARLGSCLGGEVADVDRVRGAMEQVLRVPLAIDSATSWPPPAELCEGLKARSRGHAVCEANEGRAGVRLSLKASSSAVEHTSYDTVRQLQYLASRDTVVNPDFVATQNALNRADDRVNQLDVDSDVAMADCHSAQARLARAGNCDHCSARTEAEYACNRANALVNNYNSRARQRNQTANQLQATPTTVTHDRHETYRYTERTHRWSKTFSVSLNVMGRGLSSNEVKSVPVFLEAGERTGFEPGGLLPLVPVTPVDDAYERRAIGPLADAIWAVLRRGLETDAQKKLAGCAAGDDECAWSAKWHLADDLFLTWMESVKDELVARRSPYPAAACLR